MDRGIQRRTLLATMLGVFVAAWPSVILVASLPEITKDLGASTSTIAWVIALPMLVSSVMLPTFGRLGDLEGQRRVFLIGLGVCGLGAILTAFAWNAGSLIALRTLSQASGMATTPTAIALLMDKFPLAERPRALGIWAFVTAGSPALGLIFGGPIVATVGWRGVFILQGVIALAFFPVCQRWLTETQKHKRVGFDIPGGIALMIASGSILFFFDRGSAWGWSSPATYIALAVFPVAAMAFIRIEKRAKSPLLPTGLLRNRAYAAPVAAEFLCQISSNSVFFGAPLLLHDRFDQSITQTALTMLPLPLGMCVGALAGGRVAARLGERTGGLIGSISMAFSMVLFLVGFHSRTLLVIVAALIVQGIANGFVRPAMASAGGSALAPEFFGVGMATMRMIALLGSTAGISLEVTMWNIGGFSAVFTMTLIAALLATVAMTFVMPRSRLNSLTPDERRQEERERLEEMETDTALTTLPAFEG